MPTATPISILPFLPSAMLMKHRNIHTAAFRPHLSVAASFHASGEKPVYRRTILHTPHGRGSHPASQHRSGQDYLVIGNLRAQHELRRISVMLHVGREYEKKEQHMCHGSGIRHDGHNSTNNFQGHYAPTMQRMIDKQAPCHVCDILHKHRLHCRVPAYSEQPERVQYTLKIIRALQKSAEKSVVHGAPVCQGAGQNAARGTHRRKAVAERMRQSAQQIVMQLQPPVSHSRHH